MTERDPYPYPRFENDFDFCGYRPQQTTSFYRPANTAQIDEPWNRLYNTYTWSCAQRSVIYCEPERKSDFKSANTDKTDEPWIRLYDTSTCSSSRRSAIHRDPYAPSDSLDYHLQSVYDHSKHVFCGKSKILYQEITCEDCRRKKHTSEEMMPKEQKPEIIMWVDPHRRSIYSIK